jgi:hypothetical protein
MPCFFLFCIIYIYIYIGLDYSVIDDRIIFYTSPARSSKKQPSIPNLPALLILTRPRLARLRPATRGRPSSTRQQPGHPPPLETRPPSAAGVPSPPLPRATFSLTFDGAPPPRSSPQLSGRRHQASQEAAVLA